jgi:hypothetical protein
VGFLNPNNLLWALSLAVLFAIYLRSRSRPTLEVSSLLLFDEAAAPSARVRHLHIDPLFWFEVAVLGALSLALAGLYVHGAAAAAQGRSHVLVFDLGAGMGARSGAKSRLALAKREALRIVDSAPDRDEFSVVGYAMEARMIHPQSADRASLSDAIAGLQPAAVPADRAALAAALMRARASREIDLFSDRKPPASILDDPTLASRLHFHQAGAPAANLAIVSLDPGLPNSSRGRVVIKNFSPRPSPCELAIDASGKAVFHQTLILAPWEQAAVPFGPLTAGGLVRARILSADALAADNERYALAPTQTAARVLVLSPDAAVRDDIARVLLAVNSNFIVAAADPAKFAAARHDDEYALAVMHDSYLPAVKTRATLLIYPPRGSYKALDGLQVQGDLGAAELTNRGTANATATPALLGATRILTLAQWMTVEASGTAPGVHELLPLAAAGNIGAGQFAVVAFDVRDHMLLDPDRLDALLTVVGLIREMTAPADMRIVSTGSPLAIPGSADARVIAPDGTTLRGSRDKWGRILLRPLQAGRYRIESPTGGEFDLYANYYDAAESDLSEISERQPAAPASSAPPTAAAAGPRQVRPLTALLLIVALLALLVESALLLRHAERWGMRHV